jgi:hypothetical protein
MSRSKTDKSQSTKTLSETFNPALDEPPIDPTTVSSLDKAFLARVMRFLVTVQSPAYAVRARREGYSPKEHELGWQLWRTASGQDRPLDHWFTEQATSTVDFNGEMMDKLRVADTFENTWYPRTRAIIRRVVSPETRGAFEAAFFQGLEQQPLGPSVVGSVSGLIARVQGLSTSTHPEAPKVLSMLAQRGLTDLKLKELSALIKDLENGMAKSAAAPADRNEVLKAQENQSCAMQDLHGWFVDWATTLRTAFNSRECVSLGLTVLRRSSSGGEEVVVDDENGVSASPSPAASAPTAPVK